MSCVPLISARAHLAQVPFLHLFAGFTISREDTGGDYGELRLQTLGLWNGVVVFVVHTPRGDADHIISIRKAKKHETRIYWQNFPG